MASSWFSVLQKSPSIDQIPIEVTKAEGRTIRFAILQLINSMWNKEELPEQWKESIIVSIYKKEKNQRGSYRAIAVFSYIQNPAKHPSVSLMFIGPCIIAIVE